MPTEKLRILPLGGLGEIGMNCLVVEYGEDLVLIDCGIQFPGAGYPGVDLLTPDFTYLKSRMKNLRGVVVTHGHDDHIGGIPFLAADTEVDVYCTPFPQGLISNKLAEHPRAREIRFHEIAPRRKFEVGPFVFDPIPVQHSIIESLALAIETPVGTLVHSGDFKHDPNDWGGSVVGFGPFEEWGEKGVLLLLSDSTNAERTGHTLSEVDIGRSFEQIFQNQTGRLLIALFASNIRRIENLFSLAHKAGKKVALGGRSMHSYTKLAHEQSSLNIPPDTLVLLENIHQYPDDRVIVLITGSQAEPQSALVRIAQGTHKDFQIKNGDRVILSSRFIPGNERNITSMIDHLYRLGAEVTYESIHQIHVSGHGFQEELMMMLEATRPKCFIPVHGEFRHLAKHAKLAIEAGVSPEHISIIEDGQSVELDASGLTLGQKHDLQKGIVVEGTFMRGSAALFTQRNNLSRTGVVFLVLMRQASNHKLVGSPSLSFHGLLFRQDEDEAETKEEAIEYIESIYPDVKRREDLTEVLRIEVRRFLKKRVSHKPLVVPMVLDV